MEAEQVVPITSLLPLGQSKVIGPNSTQLVVPNGKAPTQPTLLMMLALAQEASSELLLPQMLLLWIR